jgi:peroxiredoxin Q/BCP
MIREYDVTYFAASVDDADTNRRFAESLDADYPILSDHDKKVAEAYGVLRPDGGVANRWTFYIGPDGKILDVDRDVNVQTAGADLATRLGELGVAKAK